MIKFQSEEFFQNGVPNLSPTGMRQHYILGMEMRKRYVEGESDFITVDRVEQQFQISSSTVTRT